MSTPEQYNKTEQMGRQIFAALFALLISIFYLRMSQINGRLAQDLTFDDVGYANDAVERVLIASQHGLTAFLRSFLENPPHSPFSTILAIGAFFIGGINEFALYAANTLILVAVAVFITYEARTTKRVSLLLVLCVVFLSPMAYRTIHDFRPDIALGFTTALMVWWFISGLVQGEPKLFRWAGYAFAASLLVKPTFFAHSIALAIFLIGLVLLAKFLKHFQLNWTTNARIKDIAWFLGLGILISAPYYIDNWRHIFQYFFENTRGEQAEIWSFAKETPIIDLLTGTLKLTFALLGYQLFFSAITLLVCGILLFVKGEKAALVKILLMLVTALISLSIIVIGRHKNEFFLASFQWLVLLSAIYAITALERSLPTTGKVLLLGTVTAGLVATVCLNGSIIHWHNSVDALQNASWNQKIVDLLRRNQNPVSESSASSEKPTVFVSFAGSVSADTLRWVGARERFNLEPFDVHRSGDIELAKASAERANYVVLPNELRADYYRWLPSGPIQTPLLEWILGNPRFKPLNAINSDSSYFVFVNLPLIKDAMGTINVDGLLLIEGFLGEEGPYPQWALPRVRWLNKEKASLCLLNSQISAHKVSLRFRPESDGELTIFDKEGLKLQSISLTPGQFIETSFNYQPKETKSCLIFQTRLRAPPNPARLLLFSKIEIRSE